MNKSLWYWQQDGEVNGPVNWNELQSLAASGILRGTDLVRRENGMHWVPAHRAAEHADAESEAVGGVAVRPAGSVASLAPVPTLAPLDESPLGELPSDDESERQRPLMLRAADPVGALLARTGSRRTAGAGGIDVGNLFRSPEAGSHGVTALVAFACCLVGLVAFGVGMGALAAVLGGKALQGMYGSGNLRGRGWAVAAMVVGTLEIAILGGGVLMQISHALI